jgi:UPF0755 protein
MLHLIYITKCNIKKIFFFSALREKVAGHGLKIRYCFQSAQGVIDIAGMEDDGDYIEREEDRLLEAVDLSGGRMTIRQSRRRIILFVWGFSFFVGLFFLIGFAHYLVSPAKKGGHYQNFFVHHGSTLKEVADNLEKEKIITSKRFFLLWSRLMGYSRNIKAGEYRLNSGIPPLKILEILTQGDIITHTVTIPEGFNRKQIGDLLAKNGIVNKEEFLSLSGNPEIARHYGISGPGLEGYLYPDTYQFSLDLPSLSVIDAMVKRFWEMVGPLREEAKRLGLTMEEVVILASIVEKETGRPEERPIIASVFVNRLKKKMRLESDPTVIYGLEDFSGNLTRKHLSRSTPYNTYVIQGLPPGPIANPGQKAIEAVLYPAKSNYLYFVSKNDGSHYFSKTLLEHNRAVRVYQKERDSRRERHSLIK